ncbi:hypothetical protein BD560DRAFT_133203 [Blakeslea trispora]|nr:hypothetical protein BD560DRAFT_133203 [Blakeslea trispora]
MGQSPSSSMSRQDNASTRTLHSSSMHSSQPTSFFRRISNRLHVTHSTRRFSRRQVPTRHSPSITSSVRHATQEATRAAIAATGPPTNLSLADLVDTLSSDSRQSFSQYLQIPSFNTRDTTSRPILVIGYRIPPQHYSSSSSTSSGSPSIDPAFDTLSSLSLYRMIERRQQARMARPRSVRSTSSSVDTIYSMPLSIHSSNSRSIQQEGQWIVYVVHPNHPNFQMISSSASRASEGNPSYEDLLWLSNIIGPARPLTTTQAAVDEAIPATDWSEDTKQLVKDDQCPVCLDTFVMKQPVRILKCCHVFHRECVDRWLCEAHNSCPVCRRVPV